MFILHHTETHLLINMTRCERDLKLPDFIDVKSRRLTTDGLHTIYLFSWAEETDGVCISIHMTDDICIPTLPPLDRYCVFCIQTCKSHCPYFV